MAVTTGSSVTPRPRSRTAKSPPDTVAGAAKVTRKRSRLFSGAEACAASVMVTSTRQVTPSPLNPGTHAVHVVASLHAWQLAMAEAQDEHVGDVVVAAYSLPAHAMHVSVAASAYLWAAAHAVHVLASLHASQLPMAVAHDEHVVDVVVAAYSLPAHAVHVSVAASAYLWPMAHAVHVLASLHASQPAIAEAQVAGVLALR